MSTGLGRVHATSGELIFGNEHDLNLPPERSTSASATKKLIPAPRGPCKAQPKFFFRSLRAPTASATCPKAAAWTARAPPAPERDRSKDRATSLPKHREDTCHLPNGSDLIPDDLFTDRCPTLGRKKKQRNKKQNTTGMVKVFPLGGATSAPSPCLNSGERKKK